MFTKTIIPQTASVTIQLPDSYVGEEVRVIVVVEKKDDSPRRLEQKVSDIKKRYSVYPRVDLSDFHFNRDEANDFD